MTSKADVLGLLAAALRHDEAAGKALADLLEEAGEAELASSLRTGKLEAVYCRGGWPLRISLEPDELRYLWEVGGCDDPRLAAIGDEKLAEVGDAVRCSDDVEGAIASALNQACLALLGFLPGDCEDADDADADGGDPGGPYECWNCRRRWSLESLHPVQGLYVRVDPGEPMPAGQCPLCRCLCHEREGEGGGEQD